MRLNSDVISSAAVLLCLCVLLSAAQKHEREQDFAEQLFLKHLPDGRVLASFEFTTTWDIHPLTFTQPHAVWHYEMFPRSLAEVITHYRVQELHLTLTQGKWRTRMWGYPPQSVPPGAEFWTWFLPNTDVDSKWPGLVNAMSGLLCSHLNAIDSTSTYQPMHSFKPQGAIIGNISSTSLRYAALPRETVCTENFTPWTKLLPCGSTAGLGSLFSALQLYNSDFHSLGLHFTPFCKDTGCSAVAVKLLQTLSVVLKPPVSKGFIEWSLGTLFSGPLTSVCPLASQSRLLFDTDSPQAAQFSLSPPPSSVSRVTAVGAERELSVYDLHSLIGNSGKFNLAVKSVATIDAFQGMPVPPILDVQSFLTGSGHEGGGLHTTITNGHPTAELRVLYLSMVPWFTRVYIHSLQVSNGTVLWQHYTPAKDRARPHTLELLLSLPPLSTSTLTLQFSRAFLTWTEHPPDAHHGFYINSAVLTTVLSECPNCTIISTEMEQQREIVLRLHTAPLLVTLPTPDFSMPYNVICFVCTVIAIGFGSIFNLTTRTLQPAGKAQGLVARLFGRLRRTKQGSASSSSDTESSNAAEDMPES